MMERLKQLGGSLGLVGIELLAHVSMVSAHAGETHPPPGADPWPVVGPVVALVASGAAYWLANREAHDHSPHAHRLDSTDASDRTHF